MEKNCSFLKQQVLIAQINRHGSMHDEEWTEGVQQVLLCRSQLTDMSLVLPAAIIFIRKPAHALPF